MTGTIQLYMKRILYVVIVFALSRSAFAQLIPDDDILLAQDSLIYPVYDYDYIPDVTFDSIQQRITEIEKTTLNKWRNSF